MHTNNLADSAAIIDSTAAKNDSLPYDLDRRVENNAFKVGEKLSFIVRYGFIKAGDATMEVEEITSHEGHQAYRIVSKARSTRTFDWVFKVRDQVESLMDTRGLFSWQFNKRLREGSYKFDLSVDYNQKWGSAEVNAIRYHDDDDLKIKKQESYNVDIPPYVLDILGSFYYVRTQDLRVGRPIYITNHDNKKTYDLQVLIQKKEIIETQAGKFRCIMVQPKLLGEGIFKQKGELWVWLTDDKYKIPVQMKSAVFVGSITTELVDIKGVPTPLPSQIK
ncbi:MAG: DUF3108 domain-containing protein [Calditrichia bacterium]